MSPRRTTRRSTQELKRDVPLGDSAMFEYARTLAQTFKPDALSRLQLRAVRPTQLRRLSDEAKTLLTPDTLRTPAMEWFLDNARLVEGAMITLQGEKSPRLPATHNTPRIQLLMRELVMHGDAHVDISRLLGTLTTFDDTQPLRMSELWAAPTALKTELLTAFLAVSEQVIDGQRDRVCAEEWINSGANPDTLPSRRRSATFYEHALQLLHEEELSKARRSLEEWLERHEAGPDAAIRLAHADQAIQRLWLSNIMGSLRMLDSLDWMQHFESLSRTERELQKDPAGTYLQMDEESKSALRNELAAISMASDLSETTVARQAVTCAQEYLGQGSVQSTVCWWLYDDSGRKELMRSLDASSAVLRSITPDPKGKKYLVWIALLSVAFFILFWESTRSAICVLFALPLALSYAASLINHICARMVKPHMLLKLDFKDIPTEHRTLITIPALLSSTARAKETLGQLEALGSQQSDENIDLLLLGDFKDGPNEYEPTDGEILDFARAEIARMNRRAGREKYFYLNRTRTYCEVQENYMGYERKRGALMTLNQLLLTGEADFDAEGERAKELYNRHYAYVIPLDAGTWMLPGTAHKLIGAMAHPLNTVRKEGGIRKGYAVLQPRMEQASMGRLNRFATLMAGLGGVDSYPTCVSEVYQDLCGVGIFGGKGIYDLHAFDAALSGVVPDGAILSHDLFEGLIAGAGMLGDVALYDAFPETPGGYFSRMNRWTRGDWQLIPFIDDKRGLGTLEQYLMFDNLRRSLTPVSALLSILVGLWFANPAALLIGLIFPFVPALLGLPRIRRQDWVSCALRLSLLPVECYQLIDAILRTLYRLTTSHKNLLSWVTAADSERSKNGQLLTLPGRIMAILMLPALLRPDWIMVVVGLGALFLTPELQIHDDENDLPYEMNDDERNMLKELAQCTWHFFEEQVQHPGNGLPPDNVQISPPVGAARRTSPTNIGLYMTSCLSAWKLGLIDEQQMLQRLESTTATLEKLQKWRGQLYNWYDIDSLAPLTPKYVSAVDGGNLAACLMAVASALQHMDGAEHLSKRMDALCRDMEFEALFDEQRKLFVIGADVERDRLSSSHYDLLASESRILSFAAMAMGKIPTKHWSRLGRALAQGGNDVALASWSGTMFEYLMPELLLRSPAHSLLGSTNRAVVKAHIQQANGFVWGISESGYNAFDMQMNYQYRAFGLPQMALRGDPYEKVIAPYASVLALPVTPREALTNIRNLIDRDFTGDYGLYEAIDCTPARLPDGVKQHVVKSFMAHHQGMILCALVNALEKDFLVNCFMDRPEVRGLSLMLCERKPDRPGINRRKAQISKDNRSNIGAIRTLRRGNPLSAIPDTHMMYGGGGTFLTAADGRSFLRVNGVMANRWQLNNTTDEDGMFVHVRLTGRGTRFVANGKASELDKKMTRKVTFEAGNATWVTIVGDLELRMTQCVSPEDGALVQNITMHNSGAKAQKMELTGCFAVALSAQADMQAHPVFQNLFVESANIGENALVFRRRPRDEKGCPLLLHAMFGAKDEAISHETDLSQLIGREGSIARAGGIAKKLTGSVGRVLNPCSALRVKLTLEPGEKRELGYVVALCEDEEHVKDCLKRHTAPDAARRAQMLSQTQARAMLDFLGMNAARHALLQRSAAFLNWPKLRFLMDEAPLSCSISGLWALGISGDLPIISAFISSKDHLELAREAMRAHEFYRAMGVWCDLVLVNEYGNNYEQPVRDSLREFASSSHLRELIGEAGGVFLLEGATLAASQRALIRSVSSIALIGGEGSMNAQISRRLNRQEPDNTPPTKPYPTEDVALPSVRLETPNGWGGFSEDGGAYVIDLLPGKPTPAPWCNLMASPEFGTMVTERGGGFTWRLNSRSGRLTPFVNDPLKEGFTERIYLLEAGKQLSLLPEPGGGRNRFRVTHKPGLTKFESETGQLGWSVSVFIDEERPIKCMALELKNKTAQPKGVQIKSEIQWLMGVGDSDARLTRITQEGDLVFARGAMDGVGFCESPSQMIELKPGVPVQWELLLGWANDALEARATISKWREQGGAMVQVERATKAWEERFERLTVKTPDPQINAMVSRWLPYQSLSGRVFGRTGLYQAGGAYGFRDQLQDMLCLIPLEPELVREHILLFAAHQFEEGDVMHWWHPERTGVRTRISDDLLFLPYVTTQYVCESGDTEILKEQVCYLNAEELKDGVHDCYQTPQVSEITESLHDHCMRAIRRACRFGPHGLPLMGGGDWNDGMNRVGEHGQGESVWLGEFLAVVAKEYAELCTDETEKDELIKLSEQMKQAVEGQGWDGQWYRRAYFDNGAPLGSAQQDESEGCRIDAIAQSWAVIAGLEDARIRSAMDQVWAQLVDQKYGLIKLLTPPFDAPKNQPGYIMGYPPGIRENGGQYTHGACWVVVAYALLGQAERAWQTYEMLMPYGHSNSEEAAQRYRVEPYVVAADVYSQPPFEGRGGWTWYTGAAAWLCRVMTKYLLGYERRGDTAKMNALLPDKWNEAQMTIRFGGSRYTLISRKGETTVTVDGKTINTEEIQLVDDGCDHLAIFPSRFSDGALQPQE